MDMNVNIIYKYRAKFFVAHFQMYYCYVIIVRGCIDAVWLLFDDFSEISVRRKIE